MKVAFHYPSRCTGRPIDPEHLWDSPRGLTGSESACIYYARELESLGHRVDVFGRFVFGRFEQDAVVHGVRFRSDDQPIDLGCFDAVCSWMSPDFCKAVPPTVFRLYNEQCSDHGNTPYSWEDSVDLFCPLSRSHAEMLVPQSRISREKVRIMPNGVDSRLYRAGQKIAGKCVWASSHDRGLHHLLEIWPLVRRAVPHATLDVYYDDEGMRRFAEMPVQEGWPEELRRRSVYSLDVIPRLEKLGVRMMGSASREKIARAFSEAEVLAYPCDPVRYTETFGSTVLEAMAAECLPVLCLSDAFASLWGGFCPALYPPYEREHYAKLLISVLSHPQTLAIDARRVREAALSYEWHALGQMLERTLLARGREGFERF